MTKVTRNSGVLSQLLGSKKSLDQNRRWALFVSYACLIVFVLFFSFATVVHVGDLVKDKRRNREPVH